MAPPDATQAFRSPALFAPFKHSQAFATLFAAWTASRTGNSPEGLPREQICMCGFPSRRMNFE